MSTVAVLNIEGKEVGQRVLLDSVFAIEPNLPVLHMCVVNHLANCRQGTQSTLTRTEVRGGGRKPWRQKGTGHARQGSTRSPQWVHGGVALGPKPRSYRFSLNKKVKKLAMRSALSSKLAESELVLVDNVEMNEYSTKKFMKILSVLGADKKALVVLSKIDDKVKKSASNIKGVKTAYFGELNVYDILNHDKLILDIGALNKIEEVYE